MKFLYDLFPLLVFFIAYKIAGIYVATGLLIVASAVQVTYLWLRYRRIEKMHWIAFALILIFGGATLLLHDAKFLQWKVSIINWLFGLAFLATQWFTAKPLIQRFMDNAVQLPMIVWKRLNLAWGLFFIALGIANWVVFQHYSLNFWVDFKVFGLPALTVLFVICQTVYLYRHLKDQPNTPA